MRTLGVAPAGNTGNRCQERPAGHCGGGSVPALAAGGGPIWIGGAAGAVCARAAGRAGAGGRFCGPAAGAGPGPVWLSGCEGSSVMMLTGGMEAAEGKLIPFPTLGAGPGGGGAAATGAAGAAADAGCGHPAEFRATRFSKVRALRLALTRFASANSANFSHFAALQPSPASTWATKPN